ncbi:MAG: hypothetical protein HZA11_12920 [Nitrospirae bacterium]|nr:hypothetical protein [Nitrospirota bacterium]
MTKIIIYSIISLTCFVGLTLFSQKHTNKYIAIFWWICFSIALALNVEAIYSNYKNNIIITNLNSEITNLKTKELQKNFKPLSNKIKSEVNNSLKTLLTEYPNLKNKFLFMCVNPSKDTYQKALELVEIFKTAGINAEYTNTILSANANVVLLYPADFSNDKLNKLSIILLKIFDIKQISVKQNDANDFILYILGSPYFDDEGKVFY